MAIASSTPPGNTSIAFFQLLVNVVFAALLGAILATIIANIPKRALYVTAGCIAVISLGVGVFAFCQAAAIRAESDEKNTQELIFWPRASETMYTKFRNAATNWRLALRFDQATRVEKMVTELQQHPQKDRGCMFDDLIPQAPAQTPQATRIPRALPVAPVAKTGGDIFDEIERADAEYNDAIKRGDLGAMRRAEAELRALGIDPTKRK